MSAPSPLAPITFLLQTLVSQLIALGTAMVAWESSGNVAMSVLAATSVGFATATFLGLPTPWRIVNVLLPISISMTLAVPVPSWLFAVPFAALAVVHAPALWTRVPYYPTSRGAYPLILAQLPPAVPFTFIDIGCGCGDLLVFLKKHRPLGRYYGVEIGVFPFLVSKFKALRHGAGAITISFQDIRRTELRDFDYVYAFLSPAAMTSVWKKAYSEMKPGSTFITNSFEVPSQPDETLAVKDSRRSSLFVHRMGEQRVSREVRELRDGVRPRQSRKTSA